MIQEYLLQILLIVAGILLFLCTINSLARKKLTETISMFWGVMALLFVVAGLLLLPLNWNQYVTLGALLVIAACFGVLLVGMFYLSQLLSFNIRKTQELAMQVSLLNQEHIKVDHYLTSLSGESRYMVWRTNTVAEQPIEECKREDMLNEECSVCN